MAFGKNTGANQRRKHVYTDTVVVRKEVTEKKRYKNTAVATDKQKLGLKHVNK